VSGLFPAEWLNRVVLNDRLPPGVIEMRGARGSTVRVRVGDVSRLEMARWRKRRQALDRRDRRKARRLRRGGWYMQVGWRRIGATEQPWDIPGAGRVTL